MRAGVPQFSHYVIFFIAIFTVLQLVLLGASTYPIKRRWDSAAYKSKEEVRKATGGEEPSQAQPNKAWPVATCRFVSDERFMTWWW